MEETTNTQETKVEETLSEGHEIVVPANLEPEAPEKETKWYVLRVVSGKERKVKEYLDKDVIRNGWDTIVKQICCPVEKV